MKPAPALDPTTAAIPAPAAQDTAEASSGQPPPRTATLTLVPEAHVADAKNLIERYLDTQQPSGRPTLRSAIKRAARALGVDTKQAGWEEQVRWELLQARQVEKILDHLYLDEKKAPATVNTTLASLKGLARLSWQEGGMREDDYRRIRDIRGLKKRRLPFGRLLSPTEIEALSETSFLDPTPNRGARDWATVALIGGAGLRRAEAAAIQLSDYDRETHTIIVHGKGDHQRLAYVEDKGSRQALADWLSVRGTAPGALLCPVHRSGTIRIRQLNGHRIYRIITNLAERAGVRHFSPHSLRKTFATIIIAKTGNIRTAQQLLGHSDIRTTTIYDLQPEETLRHAAGFMHIPTLVRRKRKPPNAHRKRRRTAPGAVKVTKRMMREAARSALEKRDEVN